MTVEEQRAPGGPAVRPADAAQPTALAIACAVIFDLLSVGGFAAAGRGEHDLAVSLAGVWSTAWPFLAGLLVGWIISRAPRRPTAIMPTGVTMWLSTVVIGMALRYFIGEGGVAPAFIAVATGMLLLTLMGWRIIWTLISMAKRRARAQRTQ